MNGLCMSTGAATDYHWLFDGGTCSSVTWYGGGPAYMAQRQTSAIRFLVDPTPATGQYWLTESIYTLNTVQMAAGVNWTLNESSFELFSGGEWTSQYGGDGPVGLSLLYAVVAPYWNASEKAAFLAKYYNDLDDPNLTPCVKTDADSTGHNSVVNTGAVQAGTNDATHVTLGAGASASDSAYNNMVVQLGTNSNNYTYCLVSAYVGASKVAACASAIAVPTVGMTYSVLGTITVANATHKAVTTITGYGTNFTSTVHVGDAVFGHNNWVGFTSTGPSPGDYESYVTAVNSDTSLSVINSDSPSTSTTVPSEFWFLPQWHSGDCGFMWVQNHQLGVPGANTTLYPQYGGQGTIGPSGMAGAWSNTAWSALDGPMSMDIAAAGDDSRAIRHLAIASTWVFDYLIRPEMNYSTGISKDGLSYSTDAQAKGKEYTAFLFKQSFPSSYPSLDQSNYTGWLNSNPLFWIYDTTPSSIDGQPWMMGYGYNSVRTFAGPNSALSIGMSMADAFYSNPQGNVASYYRNYLDNVSPGFPMYGTSHFENDYAAGLQFLHNDPRVGSSNWKAQPPQFAFIESSASRCTSLTGWPCPSNFKGYTVLSRTGWSSKTDTLVRFDSPTFWSSYDPPNSLLLVNKNRDLLSTDTGGSETNSYVLGSAMVDGTDTPYIGGTISSAVKFRSGNNANVLGGDPGYTPVIRWASANHGTWNHQYGDQNGPELCPRDRHLGDVRHGCDGARDQLRYPVLRPPQEERQRRVYL